VRTTLTLADDVASRLQTEARRRGLPFKVVVNECLRAGLVQRRQVGAAPDFHVTPVDLGGPLGATLCTTDRDFRRFDGLKLLDPTAREAHETDR
jgi:hypothetical protein